MMKQIHIDLSNCFGIGKLEQDIVFTKSTCCLIYAPNGTMKTSFTKTVNALLSGKEPEDSIFKDRQSSAKITIDNVDVSSENCYVFNNKKNDGDKSISTFLANSTLKDQYEEIRANLSNAWSEIVKSISSVSRSSDCEHEIHTEFRSDAKQTLFDCLEDIYVKYFEQRKGTYPLYSFKYNDVFDKKGNVKSFIDKNKDLIQTYFKDYESLIAKSALFTSGEDSFGTYQANQLLKSVDDDRFFKAKHEFVLNTGKVIDTKDKFKELLETEIKKVISDEKLKKSFDKIESALQRNAELRAFKDAITQDPTLIPKLADYEHFRKEVLLGYIGKNIDAFSTFIQNYRASKVKISQIINQAKNDVPAWTNIIDLFNNRFFVPFIVEIENQEDVILNEEAPSLRFKYKDLDGSEIVETQDDLIKVLSLGEERAFHILENLFEIEARKMRHQETLLILDDIADSFDYKNKYAIIEYLHDLLESGNFGMIILTHNFDFYRTVCSRLNPSNVLFALRNTDRKINLSSGIYKPDIISSRLIRNINKEVFFIALLPFARNIIEYTDGSDSTDYHELTYCLHSQSRTLEIKMQDILGVYKRHLFGAKSATIEFGDKKYLDILFTKADEILQDENEVEIANKMVLSIAIRIKAEKLMGKVLSEDELSSVPEDKRETGRLLKLIKKYHGDKVDLIMLMDQVVMFTSENIHFNNFMFEPLVDISILRLKKLYSQLLKFIDENHLA